MTSVGLTQARPNYTYIYTLAQNLRPYCTIPCPAACLAIIVWLGKLHLIEVHNIS